METDETKSSIFTAEPVTTTKTEFTEDTKDDEFACDTLDNRTRENKLSDKEHTLSNLCMQVEISTFLDAERY